MITPIIISITSDTIIEVAIGGTVTVLSSLSYTLGDNLNNLILTGAGAINGTGNNQNNIIIGNGANNTLDGGSGADTLIGGAGDDTYIIDSTSDTIIELAYGGTDTVLSSLSYTLDDNLDNLTLTGTSAINGTGNSLDNTIIGNAASNILSGGGGNDFLSGGDRNDTLDANNSIGNDTLSGGDGNDTLFAADGNNTLSGDVGNDLVVVSGFPEQFGARYITGNNTLNGGDGNDTLDANYSIGNNILNGADGNDALNVDNSKGNNTLNGGAGDDSLEVYAVVDWVPTPFYPFTGDNILNGGDGNDFLNATYSAGNNTLIGGDGNDTLCAGYGQDTLTGGSGDDSFTFYNPGPGIDTVTDFTASQGDIIDVSAGGFGGGLLAGAAISPTQFVLDTAAQNADNRFIYNTATGVLLLDSDGTGAAAAVQLTTLSNQPTLTNNDIFVVG